MATPQTPRWYPKRGEVYWTKVDKRRPCIVLSIDALNRASRDVSVVPLTSVHHKAFRLRVLLTAGEGGLPQASWAKCDQVNTVPRDALRVPPIGMISRTTLQAIEQRVKLALGIA